MQVPGYRFNLEKRIRMDLKVGDVIKMKKQHPCGTNQWLIKRVGMDIRMECAGCGHQVMLPRKQVEKGFRGIIPTTDTRTYSERCSQTLRLKIPM